MKKLKTAVIGMGYIGASHIDAVRRIAECELYVVADANSGLAKKKAELFGVPRCYDSFEAVLADPDVEVVHNCTPNNLHTRINKAVISAGKHLLTEKPLALNSAEATDLIAHSKAHPQSIVGVNFNYRMNPMVQEMRRRMGAGMAGEVLAVSGSYLQDWLLYDTDYSWRLEPDAAGPSCCIADIGSHWMDTVQHVTGLYIIEVMADIRTVFPKRKKPASQAETFSTAGKTVYEKVDVKNEEYASVLFHLSNGAAGSFIVSEVSAGHGCYFQIEINGSKASLMWNQEQNDRLWIGRRGGENALLIRDPAFISPEVLEHTSLAKGHPEGWNDAFTGNIRAFYRYIAGGAKAKPDFATLEEAGRIVRLTEACIESYRSKKWVQVEVPKQHLDNS
jgi:predicted dehydrogenase